MSNDMIITTYRISIVEIIEGAILLLLGMKYGFLMMLAGVVWKSLIELANEEEGDDEDAGEEADARAEEIDQRESA